MHPQMPPQQLPQFQAQQPQQSQNVGQQRQAPNGQPQTQAQAQGQTQQKPAGQQQSQNPYANYDPQLALFTLAKPKNADTWEDVAPEQQHVTIKELQSDLAKFRKNRGSVKKALNEIPSANCRRIINELVEDQTKLLWKYNKTLQYTIASVENEWRSVNRSTRQLKRVEVILETVPSGYVEPTQKAGGAGAKDPSTALGANKVAQNGIPQNQQFQGQLNGHGPNMGQQPKNNQQQQHPGQHMGQNQHFDQGTRVPPPPGHGPGGNAPPPPPPPGGGGPHGMGGGMGPGAPPPPPPGHSQGMPMQQPHMQHPPPQSRGPMPGAYPEAMPPPHGMRQGHMPFATMDPKYLKSQKSKHKARGDLSPASSTTDSDDWESDSSSSGSEPVQVINVGHGDYGLVDRRERGRSHHASKSKKSRPHKSHGKHSRSRSRSRSHARVIVDPYDGKSSRRRRNSGVNHRSPTTRKYSPTSSTASLPRTSDPRLPPIHIHMNSNSKDSSDEHDFEKIRERRASRNVSPTSFYPDKRKLSKINTSLPMSRTSSWDRASGTESLGTSSIHTTEDAIFDPPMRRPSLVRGHSRQKSHSRPQDGFNPPQPSHTYDNVDRRATVRYTQANDYPHDPKAHMRSSYFEEPNYNPRPSLPHRRNSMQVPPGHPFTPSYISKPTRSMSYAADMHEPAYVYPQQRFIDDRADQGERIGLQDIQEALQHIQESKRVPLKRRESERRGLPRYLEDEWDSRNPGPSRVRYSQYGY